MEYCCHGSLKRVLKNPTIIYSVATIVSWIENILSALAFLAENHKIHRDIKADNIMIDDSFTLKLGDFGSVKETEKTAFDSIFGGTPGYMAPEVCKERKFSHRSDIFSVGKVLKEIVERRLLHEDTSSSTPDTNKDSNFLLAVRCPKEIRELITDCTKEKYQQRKSAAELLLEIRMWRELFSKFPSIDSDTKETILWLPIGLDGTNDRHAVCKDENFYVPGVPSFPTNLPDFEDDPGNVIYELSLAVKNEKEVLLFAKSLSLNTMIPRFYCPHKIREDVDSFLSSLATDLRFQFPFSNRFLDFHNTENVKFQSLVSKMDEKNLETFAKNLRMLIDGAKNLQYIYSYNYGFQENPDRYEKMNYQKPEEPEEPEARREGKLSEEFCRKTSIESLKIPVFLNISYINEPKSKDNLTYEYIEKQLDHILQRDYATQHFVYSSIFETLMDLKGVDFVEPWNRFRSLQKSLENLEEMKKIFTKDFYFHSFSNSRNSKIKFFLISAENFLFIDQEFTKIKQIFGNWETENDFPMKLITKDGIFQSNHELYHLKFEDLKNGLTKKIKELEKNFQKRYKTKRFLKGNRSNLIFRLNQIPKFACICSTKCDLISGIPTNFPKSLCFAYPRCSSGEYQEYLELYTLFLKSFDYLQKWYTDLSFSLNQIKELIIEMKKTRKCTNYFLFLTHSNPTKRQIFRIFLDFPENFLNLSYNVKFLNTAFQIKTRSVINFKNDYKFYYLITTEMMIELLEMEISCFQEKSPAQKGMLKSFEDFWSNLQLHDPNDR